MSQADNSLQFLGRTVTVTIDRPLGSNHPTHGFRYPLNYGFLPATLSGDGEELDAYILGVAVPLAEFTGECIAVIQRAEERDDKLVVVRAGTELSADEIRRATHFQEQYFSSRLTVAG